MQTPPERAVATLVDVRLPRFLRYVRGWVGGARLYTSFSIGLELISGVNVNLQRSIRCPSNPSSLSSQIQSAWGVPLILLLPEDSAETRKYQNARSCVVFPLSLLSGGMKNLPTSRPAYDSVSPISSAWCAPKLTRHVDERNLSSRSLAAFASSSDSSSSRSLK